MRSLLALGYFLFIACGNPTLNGDDMNTQPAIAGGYAPPGSTDGTYSPYTWGGKLLKNVADGSYEFTLDSALAVGTYVWQVTPILNSLAQNVSVVTNAAAGNISIRCLDKADAAIDAGIVVTVFPVPKQL